MKKETLEKLKPYIPTSVYVSVSKGDHNEETVYTLLYGYADERERALIDSVLEREGIAPKKNFAPFPFFKKEERREEEGREKGKIVSAGFVPRLSEMGGGR